MMRKAILAACLAVGFYGPVQAATYLHLDGYCDAIELQHSKRLPHFYATRTTGCDFPVEIAGIGTGPVNLKSAGKQFVVGYNLDDNVAGYHGEYMFFFSYPFVTGGTWQGYNHIDNKKIKLLNSGTYTVSSNLLRQNYGLPSIFPKR
jgi:hypothetical protein